MQCPLIEWNFFASSHGKGAVDGVGAIVKRKVWQLTKAKKLVIPDAFAFYQCAEQNMKELTSFMLFISADEIEKQCLLHKLNKKWENIKSCRGISKLRYFYYDGKTIKAARTAYSEEKQLI